MILFLSFVHEAEASCRAEARAAAHQAHFDRWLAERDRLTAAAAAEWTRVRAAVDRCLAATPMPQRGACAGPVEAWVRDADQMRLRMPAETVKVPTACGPRVVHLRAVSERVDPFWIGDRTEAGWVLAWMDDPGTETLTEALARRHHEARLESIARMRELMQSACPSADQKVPMLLRLARLYFDEGQYLEGTPEAADYLNRSIKVYRAVVTAYPLYDRNHEGLYFLGRSLLAAGQPEEAAEQLSALAERFPESRYVPDAYVLLGDYWRAKGDVSRARTAYERANEGARARGDVALAEKAEAALRGLPE